MIFCVDDDDANNAQLIDIICMLTRMYKNILNQIKIINLPSASLFNFELSTTIIKIFIYKYKSHSNRVNQD